jgi:Ca-activated chloride channel homolog
MERIELPQYLLLLSALPVLMLAMAYASWWKKRARSQMGLKTPFEVLAPQVSVRRNGFKALVSLLVLGLMAIAIANPQSGSKVETMKREGIDLLFAIDVSNSMLAEDVSPNRISRARQFVSECLDRLGGDRVGIIVYAGEAQPQLPITSDLAAARLFLSQVNTDLVNSQGTAFNEAIDLAVTMFGEESLHSKALIFISDGEDHEGDFNTSLKAATDKGIRVFSLGIGDERGGPIPIRDSYGRSLGFKEDGSGNKVITKLNEAFLQSLAAEGGGVYLQSKDNKKTVSALLDALSDLEKTEFESRLYTDYEDQFYWFAGLALLLVLLDVFLIKRKTKWLERLFQ